MKQIRRKTLWFGVMTLTLALSITAAAEEMAASSRVTHVTLYRSQAQVTRTVTVTGGQGAKEILVSDLPENIVADSLFAEGNEAVEVRAVQFRSRAVGTNPRKDIQELRDKMDQISDALELNKRKTKLLADQGKYLDKLENFVAPTATSDLSKGVLDAKALREVTLFAFEQRSELVTEQTTLAKEQKELVAEQTLTQRKLAELTSGSSKTVLEAVVFVQKKGDDDQPIRLNYLVNNCSWSPSYTARAKEGADAIRLEYNGLIRQMTGEDWSNVSLVLSSASPALSASGPGLAPFRVTLSAGQMQTMGQAGQLELGAKNKDIKSLLTQQRQYNFAFQNSIKLGENLDNSWQINDTANQLLCAELTADENAVNINKEGLAGVGEQPSMNYKIESAVSISSRNTQQVVRIMSTEMKSDFYHVATPILTSYVYREAAMNNSSQQDLLGGPMSVYLDDRFVGRSEIPSVARGQTFVVGLGADAQLRTRRELVDKENSFTGGNRETQMKYRLVVENYKDKPVNVRVLDRMPIVNDESNIRITLLPMDNSLSEDEDYLRLEAQKGILRWDEEVPPRAIGNKAAEIAYGFKLEYDRQYQVALPSDLQKQKQEFEKMQMYRNRRMP